jgi:hypothetical protein
MSGIEVVGLILGVVSLFPIVTDSWNRYEEDSPEVASFQALQIRFKGVHQLYKSSSSLIFPGQNLEALVGNPHDCTEERIRQFLDAELQRPEIREVLEILKPTAEHINKVLVDLKLIFTPEVRITRLLRTD